MMLKLFLTLVFFAFVALLGIWIDNHNFPIVATFLNYQVETSAARLWVAGVIAILFIYAALKLIGWVKNSPKRFAKKLQKDMEKQGFRDLMQGFSALAAGDNIYAKKLADRAEAALKNQPIVKLLQAQVAVLSHKSFDAEKYYSELSKNADSRIIGYRGLISQAIDSSEMARALDLAEDLCKLNPNSVWVNEVMIDLALRNNDFEKAEKYTLKAAKEGVLNKISANINLAIIHFFYAKKKYAEKDFSGALADLKLALKYNSKFLPASLMLAKLYYETWDYKAGMSHIEQVWKQKPHPQLAEFYELCSDRSDASKTLKRFEKLMKSNAEDVESILAFARLAIRKGEHEKARKSLEIAVEIRETKQVCLLMAEVANKDLWLARAQSAQADKAWLCSQTGLIYADWQLFSAKYGEPAGASVANRGNFNTIIWDYPQDNFIQSAELQNPIDSFLLIK